MPGSVLALFGLIAVARGVWATALRQPGASTWLNLAAVCWLVFALMIAPDLGDAATILGSTSLAAAIACLGGATAIQGDHDRSVAAADDAQVQDYLREARRLRLSRRVRGRPAVSWAWPEDPQFCVPSEDHGSAPSRAAPRPSR